MTESLSYIYIYIYIYIRFWGEVAKCRRRDPAIQNIEEETNGVGKFKKSSLI